MRFNGDEQLVRCLTQIGGGDDGQSLDDCSLIRVVALSVWHAVLSFQLWNSTQTSNAPSDRIWCLRFIDSRTISFVHWCAFECEIQRGTAVGHEGLNVMSHYVNALSQRRRCCLCVCLTIITGLCPKAARLGELRLKLLIWRWKAISTPSKLPEMC